MIDRILLFPYYFTLKLRDKYYKKRASRLFSPEVPSVCVGNVTAGGTGKTPMVELILRMLRESPEWQEGISRCFPGVICGRAADFSR